MKRFVLPIVLLVLAAPLIVADLALPVVPAELRTPSERADYIALHFWDAMDFGAPSALDEAELSQNVANFLSVLPHTSGDSARVAAVDKVVRAAAANEEAALLFSQTIESYLFAAASPMRDERLYTVFLERMLDAAYPDSVRSRWMLDMTAKNMEGTPATDFTFTDRNGAQRTLYGCLGKPTLLFFYDPDCDLCHAAAEEMARDIVLSTRVEQGRAAIIAISPGEMDAWKAHKASFPSTWTDGCDGGIIDENELYMIAEYPEFYVLAPDGTVVLKAAPLSKAVSALLGM